MKVFRDGNSLFHCARLGEIVCQARERGASAGGAGADDGIRNDPLLGRGDSVAAVLRRGIRSLGRAQAAATAAALRRGAMDRVLAVEEDEADEEGRAGVVARGPSVVLLGSSIVVVVARGGDDRKGGGRRHRDGGAGGGVAGRVLSSIFGSSIDERGEGRADR